MEFMLLFTEPEDAPPGDPAGFAAMGEFAGELRRQKKLRRGAPLEPGPTGAWVRVRGGKASVTDGPFVETKEVVGGFFLVDVADRAEAIEIARRCPHAEYGIVEVHPVARRYIYEDRSDKSAFMLLFRMEPGLSDPDGSKLQEMLGFSETLSADGTLFETAPLASDPPPARIETRARKRFVTDGPFVETKEGVGGYALIRVASRADAIELAKRYPHATWGPVEVREIPFFDQT